MTATYVSMTLQVRGDISCRRPLSASGSKARPEVSIPFSPVSGSSSSSSPVSSGSFRTVDTAYTPVGG